MLLLKKNITKKERVDKKVTKLEFEAGKKKDYEMKTIRDSVVYVNKPGGYLPGLCNLVIWKKYLKEENTWKPLYAVQHLKKLINSFYKTNPEKPIAIFLPINFIPPMVRPTIKSTRPIIK